MTIFHHAADPMARSGLSMSGHRLPHGWLNREKGRYEDGPEGFVAIERTAASRDIGEPPILGWGRDGKEARAAAARTGKPQTGIVVIPCTTALRQDIADGAAKSCVLSEDGVAYSHGEPAPEELVEDWLFHSVLPAHGIRALGEGPWDELVSLIDLLAHAYLRAHPAVGLAEDGRLGWTRSASTRSGDGDVVPLAGDASTAAAEVRANLPDPYSIRRPQAL